jgi:hypothetical protein
MQVSFDELLGYLPFIKSATVSTSSVCGNMSNG